MATATVLRQIVDTLETSAVEIEAETREMYKSTRLNSIPNRHPQVASFGPTHSWAKPNDSIWKEEQRNVTRKYQRWYAATSHLIKEYAPESSDDFESLYKSDNSFSGSQGGFFNSLWLKVGVYGGNAEDAVNGYMELFEMQRSILLKKSWRDK
jgi:hypothetical protein